MRRIRRDVPAGQMVGEAPPIEDILSDLANEILEKEWEKLPSDLTDNLDHYLYGTPK